MARWTSITDAKGTRWSVNYEGAARIVMAYAYMLAFTSLATQKTYPVVGCYKPMSRVDFDPVEMRRTTQENYGRNWITFQTRLQKDGGDALRFLSRLKLAIGNMRDQRTDLFARVGQINAEREKALDWAVSMSRGTRDTCVVALGIMSGMAGGTVAVVAGASTALLKGGIKYADTGSAQEAAIEGFGGLVMVGWGSVAGMAHLKEIPTAAKGVMVGMGFVLDGAFGVAGDAVANNTAKTKKTITQSLSDAAWKALVGLAFKAKGPSEEALEAMGDRKSFAAQFAVECAKNNVEKKTAALIESLGGASVEQPKVLQPPSVNKGPSAEHMLSRIGQADSFVHRNALRPEGPVR